MKATRIMTVEERFFPRLAERPNGCIEWTGALHRDGYGIVSTGPDFSEKRHWLAHRLAWTLANGRIPDGLCVCHACDNPPCCNPAHLFLGTMADNVADRDRKGRTHHPSRESNHNSAKASCPQGHPYDDANTYLQPDTGWRVCRTCRRAAGRRAKAKRRASRS